MSDGRSPRLEASCAAGAAFTAGQAGMAGQRLDYSLRLLLPNLGQRGRKRRIESGLVLVNGRPAPAAYRLRPADVVALVQDDADTLARDDSDASVEEPTASGGDAARFLGVRGAYCFFYKPAGLHSVTLAGGSGRSLEALAFELLPDLLRAPAARTRDCREDPTSPAKRPWPRLLQRLDFGTSGIVCAALDPEAARSFREDEAAGRCEKRYVALLAGHLQSAVAVKNELRTDNRSKSLVLESAADRTRWTEFLPLCLVDAADIPLRAASVTAPCPASAAPLEGGRPEQITFHSAACNGQLTLVGCRIRRGARHQIRAHAASLGRPLWGDALYGGQGGQATPEAAMPPPGVFYLHHGGLLLPKARCVVPPPWPFLSDEASRRAVEWLEGGTPAPRDDGPPAQSKKTVR